MSETPVKTHIIDEDETGIRLDRWFRRHFPAVTQGQLQKWLRSGQVRLGGKRAEASTRVEQGQLVRVPPQVDAAPQVREDAVKKQGFKNISRIRDMILLQDDDIIVLNKPAGLAVQGGTGLLENIDDMMELLATPENGRPKLVHRLDRDTSGVLLLARNVFSAAKLAASFRERDTEKMYWAMTAGVPEPRKGEISAPIVKRGEIMVVGEEDDDEAKEALTRYHVIDRAEDIAAFVALWPVTGRTHQLRVHMHHIGTPLFGDRLYKSEEGAALPKEQLGKGLHLHARQLIIPHPRRGTIEVTAPLGVEMRKTWKWFGFDANARTD